jgi:ATP/maltotriose-dependent transcriptional regulator MalT/class 3 adenylate cyclase
MCAPAGAGKTTALRQWAAADGRPTAWVQLDASDDDPVVLLMYLLRALGGVAPVPAEAEGFLSLAVPPVRERVLPMLADALGAASPFVLVLDDAHLLKAASCWDVVAFVLRILPPGAQLALGTRADPPLPLARLRASGELAELRAPQLALDRAEVAELVRLHGRDPDEATVDALLSATEGWATGLHLACLAAGGRPLEEWLPRIRGERREIAAYLTSEVLDGQPADVQEFLLKTSVLTELTPALCKLVTGRDDAGELLAHSAREELFVVPLGDEGHQYRYHHLFAEMLEAELEARHPGARDELHRRAAGWYAEHDDPDAQVRHLLAAGESAAAADVVAAAWPGVWSRGQTETVRRWLESFTDRQVLGHKALTLTAGWVYTALDDGKLGERWGRAACGAPMDDAPSPDGAASLRSSQAMLRATVAPDGVRRMRDDAELAASLETTPGTSWYADAHVSLGVARWLSGSAQRAFHPLAVAVREGSAHNPSAELAALGYLALISADETEWTTAREYEARATARLNELGFGTSRRCLPMLLARVKLLAREPDADADVDAAAADVDRLLSSMVPHPWMGLLAHVVLGEVMVERGDMAAAETCAIAASTLLERYPDAGILRRRAERLRGAVERTRVSEPLTPAERRVLELLPTHLTEAQMAEQLFVSHNTVKSHLKSVYRKLAASSRADAVVCARQTGLLPADPGGRLATHSSGDDRGERAKGRQAEMEGETSACPSCLASLPEGSRFCSSCGARLAVSAAPREERKLVTSLFCDLVDFTALSEIADPEDVDALLREYHAAARKVIEVHGGIVEKFIGDAVVGFFGVPVAHEDDPERAVRAALRLVERLADLPSIGGHTCRVRVGVNTGQVLARLDVEPGSGLGLVAGDAVNVAARVQAIAPPMGVVVGEATYALTRGLFTYEPLEPVALKGKSAPVATWIAKAPVSRLGVRKNSVGTTPQVGRDGELAYLVSLFERAVGSSSPRVVLIVGDPGIGKTRLVSELFAYVDARPGLITWRQGRCLPYGEGRTFWALGEIVKAHAGILETDDAETVAARLERVIPARPDRDWVNSRLRPLVGLEAAPAGRDENFVAWLRFLEGLAAARPMVLFVEDLHWADDALLAFFEFLAVNVGAVPLFVVATARPELLGDSPAFAASGGRVTRVWLERLSDDEMVQLVTALPEAAAAGDDVIAAIVRRAEGNPFYAEELARLLDDTALRDVQSLVGGAASLPGTVQAVIAARIDALSAESKACLADAAVVGHTFWSGALVALGDGDAAKAEVALGELLSRRLVQRVHESSVPDEDELVFCHGLVRDVTYHGLPRGARAAKHAAFARWTEAKAGECADDRAVVLAGHFAAAVELARAAGDDALAGPLVAAAVHYLSVAGDRAMDLDAAAAQQYYARALRLAGPEDAERPSLLARLAEPLFQAARYREAADALQEAGQALLAAGDRCAAALTLARRADALYALGDPGVTGLLEEALALLEGDEPCAEMATVLGRYGKALWFAGDPLAGLARIDEAVAISRRLALPEPALLLGYRSGIRCILGDIGGLDDYLHALAAATSLGLERECALLVFNYADALLSYRGPAAAAAALRDGLASARRRRLEELAASSSSASVESLGLMGEWDAEAARRLTVNLVESLGLVGEWDEALAKAAQLAPALERSEAASDLVIVRTQEAVLRVARGEAELAKPFVDWLEREGLASEIPWIRAYALLSAAPVRLHLGNAVAALELLTRWEAHPRPGSGPNYAAYLPEAVRTALAGGDDGLAARLADGVESVLPIQRNVLATTQSLLAERRGERAAAAAGFAAAAVGWQGFEVPYEEAQALLGEGRCLLALGRAPEAAPVLAAAREIFARLGAKPALAETEALRAGLGAGSSPND